MSTEPRRPTLVIAVPCLIVGVIAGASGQSAWGNAASQATTTLIGAALGAMGGFLIGLYALEIAKSRRPVLLTLLSVFAVPALAILYALSLGPMAWMVGRGHLTEESIMPYFTPAASYIESNSPGAELLDDYVQSNFQAGLG